jgi:hypothetical protein
MARAKESYRGSSRYKRGSLRIILTVVYNSLMAAIEKFIEENRQRLPDICCGADAAHAKLA